MSSLHPSFHQVDAYLTGDLSAAERLHFEHQLQQDPLLRQEVVLQSEIVGALRAQRQLQLKQRLQELPTPSPLWPRVWIAAGGAALTALLAGSLWLYSQAPAPMVATAPLLSSAADTIQASTVVPATALRLAPDTAAVASAPAPRAATSPRQPTLRRPVVPEPGQAASATPRIGEATTPLPSSAAPAAARADLPLPRIVSDGAYSYHYAYHEAELTLYGDFGTTPYQLLELISEGRRQLYMYHKGAYYHLKASDRTPVPLKPIRDARLRKRLAQLRTP